VRVGGVTVQPGDLLHADANGVTTIPIEIAPEIADAADEYVKAETIVLDYLKAGQPSPKAFGEARKAMLDAIGALSRRVRTKQVGA
jgi:regulator of RNase E activity RraA